MTTNLMKMKKEQLSLMKTANIQPEKNKTAKNINQLQAALRQTLKERAKVGHIDHRLMATEPFDPSAHLDKLDQYDRKRKEKLNELRSLEDQKFAEYFYPHINEKSNELDAYRIDLISKTEAFVAVKAAKIQKERSEGISLLSKPSTSNLSIKSKSPINRKANDKIYHRTVEWKEAAEQKRKHEELLQAEKMVEEESKTATQKLKHNRSDLEKYLEKEKMFQEKKEKRLDEVEKEMYPFTYTPRKYNKTVKS